MKKKISLFLITLLSLMCLTACGDSLKVDKNTIYVKKNGKIIGASVETFDKNYYDAEELETYIEEQVDEYLSNHEKKSVKVDKFSVEEGIAKLNIKYAGYEDYAEFNGVEMFVGTVPQAMAAGYNFDDTFLKVEDGKLGSSLGRDELIEASEDSKYKVVILSEKVDVKVKGTVLYVSEDYTSLAAKDMVSIALTEDALDGEELKLTYIVYK